MKARFPAAPARGLRAGAAVVLALLAVAPLARGATQNPPSSLRNVRPPPIAGLYDTPFPIVTDKAAAIRLGKALFWDQNVSVDGVACASCHFHAGADARSRNQLAPGPPASSAASASIFDSTAAAPNGALRRADFPLYGPAPAGAADAGRFRTSDDVVGSGGVRTGTFRAGSTGASFHEQCEPSVEAPFEIGSVATRQVRARNAPSVINAIFSARSFWDGRASGRFNGRNGQGELDPGAGIWVASTGKPAFWKRIVLPGSALASQAMAPALDDVEMSCRGRTFPEIARRLLPRRALDAQDVHAADGALGAYRHASGRGLIHTYEQLVKRAFHSRFWSASGRYDDAGGTSGPYRQIEANFSFFFGLALQIYQSTLISDRSPFDRSRFTKDGAPRDLPADATRGFQVFVREHCAECHSGPLLSSAMLDYVATVYTPPPPSDGHTHSHGQPTTTPTATGTRVRHGEIDRTITTRRIALADRGFANTGVAPTAFDRGLGGVRAGGTTISFANAFREALALRIAPVAAPWSASICAFEIPFDLGGVFAPDELVPLAGWSKGCPASVGTALGPAPSVAQAEIEQGDAGRLSLAVEGAFKIPGLRNVELTGPYMHNGGMATLEEVVDFYDRGANVENPERHHFVFAIGLSAQDKSDLVAFLKSLTDERVRWEQAPFDHPSLRIPHGHRGDSTRVEPSAEDPRLAEDEVLELPAVGATGRRKVWGPLLPFHETLAP